MGNSEPLSYRTARLLPAPSMKAFRIHFLTNLLIAAAIIECLLFVMPHFQRVFREQYLSLPALTEWIFSCTDFTVRYLWLVIPAAIVWSGLIGMVYMHASKGSWPRRLLSWTLIALYVVIALALIAAPIIPFPQPHGVTGGSN